MLPKPKKVILVYVFKDPEVKSLFMIVQTNIENNGLGVEPNRLIHADGGFKLLFNDDSRRVFNLPRVLD